MAISRRAFLNRAGGLAAGTAALGWTRKLPAAHSDVVIGIIGCGGQGGGLARKFAEIAKVAYVCDPDATRCGETKEKVNAGNAVTDLRRILDDKSVDAVVVATPDHWHAPAAILACDAGKHVYVEKPCSHNLRESRLLVDAARRNKVVVQHGTQSRSNQMLADATQMLREGIIGDVLVAKAWNIQRRRNIGHSKPSDPPESLDYDTWIGPAPFTPFRENCFHYDWRWWYNFGTGDIGNDGTHEIDYARWGLGVTGLPAKAMAVGGKYFHNDDQQFPDTATCVFEYPGDGRVGQRRQLIFEMRLWSNNYPYNVDSGAEFYGTEGRLFVSKRGKLEVFAERDRRITDARPKEPAQLPMDDHQQDFLDAIRTGRRPNADIEIGHHSVALVHLANIAMKVGRGLVIDSAAEQIVGDDEANALIRRQYREGHWAIPARV
jgi:predicted dehydrogenase